MSQDFQHLLGVTPPSVPSPGPPDLDDLVMRAGKLRVRRLGMISLLAVAMFVGALVPVALFHRESQGAKPQTISGPVLPSGVPALGAVESTLTDAASTMPYRISRPSDPLASDTIVSKVWTSVQYGVVVIQYTSGIELIESSQEPPPANPLQALQDVANTFPGAKIIYVGADAALALVQDNPGNGCPQRGVCIPAQHNPGSVTFWRSQIQVKILGNYPTDILSRIAGTIP